MTRDAYHHGNLRAALLAAALEALEDTPAAKLSLRQVAVRLDVSANAPYAHFASKEALLAALRREGFVQLKDALIAARTEAAPGRQAQLAALGRAYLGFGRRHPNLYDLMFADAGATNEATAAAAAESFAPLRDCVQGAAGDPDLAVFAWALVHGLVTLDGADRLQSLTRPDAPVEDLAPRLAAILLGERQG